MNVTLQIDAEITEEIKINKIITPFIVITFLYLFQLNNKIFNVFIYSFVQQQLPSRIKLRITQRSVIFDTR